MRRILGRLPFAVAMLAVLVACANPSAPATTPGARSDQLAQSGQPAQRKSLTIMIPSDVNALVGSVGLAGINAQSSNYVKDFINTFVTALDQDRTIYPMLAEELPSVEKGTWVLHDDGRMDVTWKLKRGVTWHDGAEFTADAIVFGWEVDREPVTQFGSRTQSRFISAIDTPDPYTAVMRWSQPSVLGGEINYNSNTVLPRHLLAEAFAADKADLPNHPYFSTAEAFIGNGPFRPVEWVRGSHLTAEAFAGYFLGRPKLDRITFQFVPDPRTAAANVMAGAADMSYLAVPFENARVIADDWARSNGGTVLMAPSNWRILTSQFRPDRAQPRDLLDLNVRRAMAHAINRDEVVETILPGHKLAAETIFLPGSGPIADAIDRAIVKYAHDPNRASQLLADAGWRRGGDSYVSKDGERFTLEYRFQGEGEAGSVFPVIQQQMRAVGIDLTSRLMLQGQDLSELAVYPGVLYQGRPVNPTIFGAQFETGQIAAPQNRYAGNNYGGYSSAEFDRLSAELARTVRADDRSQVFAEAFRVLSSDVAYLPLVYYPQPYIVRKGVSGPVPRNPLGSATFMSHTWDVQ
jgi:peptide/nickel transport system substrate-binding protein